MRDIISITLDCDPKYQLIAYYGCDYASTALLAPSGNWYIPSTYWGDVSNTIIQKTNIMNLYQSEWVALEDAVVRYPHRMEESYGCELLVAGDKFQRSSFSFVLRLFKFGCEPF